MYMSPKRALKYMEQKLTEIKEEINAEMHKCDKINLNENDLNNKINKENKDER